MTREPTYCTGDTRHTYIGHKTNPLDGTSPNNLRAETVGDVLRRVNPQSRVIGISGKDRGAILPAGKTGTAYMYMGQTGQFASSTYYMKAHPGLGRGVQRGQAGRPLLQDRVEAAAARGGLRALGARTASRGSARAAASCPC
jgi:hypothetical protein